MRKQILLVVGALVAACSDSRNEESRETVADVAQALTSNQRILSFDGSMSGANADWHAQLGVASSSTVHVEGTAALSLSGNVNASALSAPLTTLGTLTPKAGIQVSLPASLSGQTWLGQVALFFNAPSAGVYNQYAGPVVFTGPLNTFRRYDIPIPANVVAALSGKSYNDLTVTVQLNVPTTSGAFLIDGLTLTGSAGGGGSGGSGGSGGKASGGANAGGAGGKASGGANAGGTAGKGGTSGAGGTSGKGGGGSGGNGGTAGKSGGGGSSGSGGAGASGAGGSGGALTFDFAIHTPKGVHATDVVVGMENYLEAADGVRFVEETASATHASLSNVATLGAPSYFGVQSELQNLWTGTGTDLRNSAHVYGFIQSSVPIGKQDDTVIDGVVTPNAVLTPYEVLAWKVTYPTVSLGGYSIEPDLSKTPTPGSRYDDFSVKGRATLHLDPGTYYFNSLTLEPDAHLELANSAGPIFVYVRQSLTFRGTLSESKAKGNTLFGLASRADEPMGVLDIEAPFRGIVVAPNGFMNLGTTSAGHVGSFFGASFRANPWTPIYHRKLDPSLVNGLHCQNGVRDDDETGVDCGGSCGPCGRGGGCTLPSDCASGLVCGTGNGACFGGARAQGVCWPPQCADGVDPELGECGRADSPCGPNCACATGCDSTVPNTCPTGEVCAAGLGGPLGVPTPDVCLDPRCPSNDPSLCGNPLSVCGPCICTPDCSHATCANPGDGCGGQCPNVCPVGDTGTSCGTDLHCPAGAACLTNPDGSRSCRPGACALQVLVPPLCGTSNAPCGAACPQCFPACDGRQCGPDPACGTSCGTCSEGTACDGAGQCVAPTPEPPPTVPNGNSGTVDVPPLPHVAASAVGPVHGGFSVSQVGTPEYTVPIDVPPGRAGLEPALSLKYTGTRVSGDLGTGWSLEGLSKITRCPHTFALDGYAGPITNTNSDALCLDGKRLSQVSGGPLPDKPIEYRTLIDSFAKIVAYQDKSSDGIQLPFLPNFGRVFRPLQGPDWFKVWTKDGRILTYGGAPDSLIMERNGVRNTWLLTRVEDRAGNNILITYDNAAARLAPDGGLSLVRPSVISYTGHGVTAGKRQVRFTYEERTDNSVRYFQGAVGWLVRERLSRVATYVDGAPVKNYRLVYAEQDRSQIEKIFECEGDTDARCKAPTVFTYQAETGFTAGQSSVDIQAAVQLDVDGNGIPDFLETTVTQDGVKARPEYKAAEIGADIAVGIATSFMTLGTGLAVTGGYTIVKLVALGLLADEPQIKYERTMWLGNGRRQVPTALGVQNVQGLPCAPNTPLTFFDYDRDGKDDAVGVCGGGATWQGIFVSRSDGTGNFQRFPNATDPVLILPRYDTTDANGEPSATGPAPLFVDIDGDSLDDAVYCENQYTLGVRRRLGPALAFDAAEEVPRVAAPLCNNFRPTLLRFDIDGDGSTDLVVRAPDGWKVLRYQRAQTTAGLGTLSWQPVDFKDWRGSAQGKGLTLADFNGDGLVDVWSSDGEGSHGVVWLNAGGAQFLQRQMQRPLPGQTPQFRLKRTALLDYDSDGRSDILDNYEHYKGEFNGEKLYEWDNWALALNGAGTQLESKHADDFLVPLGPNGTLVQSPMGIATDIDGDGNNDVFGLQGAVLYGTGSHNMVLKHVVDGVGNFFDIDYDGVNRSDPHYINDCEGTNWPEPCLKQMHGLVSTERQGYVDAGGDSFVERTTQYTYRNGRMSATGHGWLGFDSRSVKVSFTNGSSTLVTTDFGAPVRTTLTGAPVRSDNEPYIYPFAGLPKSVTADNTASTGLERPPLEGSDRGYRRRTRTETTWAVGLSADNRPFPKVDTQITSVFERERPEIVIGQPPPPDIEDGPLLFACAEGNVYDTYGNIKNEGKTCADAAGNVMDSSTTATWFIPDRDTWLIASPLNIAATSYRGNWTYSREVDLRYDDNGFLVQVTRGGDAVTDAWQRTDYLRNEFGNPEHIIETEGTGEPPRTTDITYDADQVFPFTITNAKQQTTQIRYDASWGALSTVIDPNNIITQRRYDGLGLLVESTDPGGTTLYIYAASQAQLVATSVGNIHPRIEVSQSRQGIDGTRTGGTITELDYRGRVVRTRTEGLAGTTIIAEQAYDPTGRPAAATLPHTLPLARIPSVAYTYDGFDRVTRVTRSDGSFVQREYADAVTLGDNYRQWLTNLDCKNHGDLQSGCPVDVERTIDEEGRQNVIVSDHFGLPLRNVDGEHIVVTDRTSDYLYGGFNSLQLIKDYSASEFTYDDYGRRLTSTDRNGVSITSTFNGFDEVTTTTDSKSQHRVYHHDELGRLTKIDDAAGESQWLYDDGPNALGRLSGTISPATEANPNGQRLIYNYEPPPSNPALNRGAIQRVDHLIDGINYAVSFDYDDLAHTKRIHYPALDASAPPVVAEYHYDPTVGILTGLDEVGANATRQLWRLTDAYQGQLIQHETFGNNAATTYVYDPERRFLTGINTTLPLAGTGTGNAAGAANAAANTIQSLTYGYYQTGRIQTRTNATDSANITSRVFAYDALNRLSSASDRVNGVPSLTTPYGYDLYGNLTERGSVTTTYRPDQPHFIDTVGANTYHYDPNGNVQSRSGPDIPGSDQTFVYTPFDMPTAITTGAATTQFEYSADEARLVRRDPDATRHFIGEFYQRLLDNASGATLEETFRLYAGGRNVGEIVRKPGTPGSSERTLFFHTDRLENVDTISTSQGEVVHQEFDVFGARTSAAANGTDLTRAGFTGHQHDVDLGLIDMRGRVYDPLAGRFTTQDPVMQAPFWSQGLNPYSYVFNDPINNTDPSGFLAIVPGYPAGAVVTGSPWGLVQGAAATGINLGISKIVGDPFDGSGPKQQSVAAGAHTSDVKGGGNGGPSAFGQNKPGVLELPPGTPEGMRMCDSGQCLAQGKPFPLLDPGGGSSPSYPPLRSAPPPPPPPQLTIAPTSAPPGLLSRLGSALGNLVRGVVRYFSARGGARGGSVGAMRADEQLLNWSWKSKPTFQHTFLTHGQGAENTRNLLGRAGGTGQAQGQWLNNEAAAQFLSAQRPYIQGPTSVSLPSGLGQVILPNGTIVPATHALLIPNASTGGFITAFPIP